MDRSILESYRHSLNNKLIALEKAKEMNQRYEALQALLQKTSSVLEDSIQQTIRLERLIKMIDKEDSEFKERRITFLKDRITLELQKIFPEDAFTASIDCDFKRGNGTASLTLKDKYNIERSPDITEGKLCQYLISFAATVATVKGLSSDNIYIDEAFGVSSEANLPRIGEIIANTVKDGMQIILVSQKPELYNEIPRKEFHLSKDSVQDVSYIESVEEFGEEVQDGNSKDQ